MPSRAFVYRGIISDDTPMFNTTVGEINKRIAEGFSEQFKLNQQSNKAIEEYQHKEKSTESKNIIKDNN